MQLEELYKELYTKYAPDLGQEELDKKLEYASTIDPNEFINGFYQKYTGQGPNQEQVDYMNSALQQPEVEEEKQEQPEVAPWQGFKNSMLNLAEQIGDLPEYYGATGDDEKGTARSTLDIVSTALNESIFGKENMLKYKNSDGILGWAFEDYIPSDSEEFIKKVERL